MNVHEPDIRLIDDPTLTTLDMLVYDDDSSALLAALDFICGQSDFEPDSFLGPISPHLRYQMMTACEHIPLSSKIPVLRHYDQQNTLWTTSELDAFPSMLRNPEFGAVDRYFDERWYESLEYHFIATGVYHPILLEIPLERLQRIKQQHPNIVCYEHMAPYLSKDIVLAWNKDKRSILKNAIDLGHAELKFWSLFSQYPLLTSKFSFPGMLLDYVNDIPLTVLIDIVNIDLSLLTTSELIDFINAHSHNDLFDDFLHNIYVPIYNVSLYELESKIGKKVLKNMVEIIFPTTSYFSPDAYAWIKENLSEEPYFRSAFTHFESNMTFGELYAQYANEEDHDAYWNTVILHLMNISNLTNRDAFLMLFYDMDYETYFKELTYHPTIIINHPSEARYLNNPLLRNAFVKIPTISEIPELPLLV